MKIERKDVDSMNATLTVNVAKADYEEGVNKQLKEMRKRSNMPGFRPGTAPISLLKQRFGTEVLVEEVNQLVSRSLYDYIQKEKIDLLGDPLPSEKQKDVDFKTDEEFTFSFDIAIAPSFNVSLSDKLKVAYYDIKCDKKLIDDQIEQYKNRFGSYGTADTTDAKDVVKGTVVELNADGTVKEGGLNVENAIVSPEYVKDEDSKKALIGKKVGDVVTLNAGKAFENDAERASFLKIKRDEAKDKVFDFSYTITEITRYTPAEVNQALFDKMFGEGSVKSEDEFRARVQSDIEKTLVADSDYRFGVDAKKVLLEQIADVQLPDAFLKRWILATNKEVTAEKIDEYYAQIKDDLKWHLIQEHIVADNGVKVEDADLRDFAKKVAQAQFAQYGMSNVPEDVLENYATDMMKDQKAVNNLRSGAINDKVIAVVKDKVKLAKKSISLEDFNKLS